MKAKIKEINVGANFVRPQAHTVRPYNLVHCLLMNVRRLCHYESEVLYVC